MGLYRSRKSWPEECFSLDYHKLTMTTATIHKTLVELGVLEPLKPGVKPSSKAAYLEKRRDAQRLRRKLKKEAKEQGLEPKLKPVGRPPHSRNPGRGATSPTVIR